MNFYHFPQFTVGKPYLLTIWLFSKQRSDELTIVFLWFFLLSASGWQAVDKAAKVFLKELINKQLFFLEIFYSLA